jgi:hypothetical protein
VHPPGFEVPVFVWLSGGGAGVLAGWLLPPPLPPLPIPPGSDPVPPGSCGREASWVEGGWLGAAFAPLPPPLGTTVPGSVWRLGTVSVDFCVGPVEGGAESLDVPGPGAGYAPDDGEDPDDEGLAASCTPFPLTLEGPVGAITLFAGACEEPVPLLPSPDDGAPGDDGDGVPPPDGFTGDAFPSSLFGPHF